MQPNNKTPDRKWKYVKCYQDISISDVALVGGKNASIGEMMKHLISSSNEPLHKMRIPNGFAITSAGYKYHLSYNNIEKDINDLLLQIHELAATDVATNQFSILNMGLSIRSKIKNSPLPPDLVEEIRDALSYLISEGHCSLYSSFALRSSATSEDARDSSFAGQLETLLHIEGIDNIIASCSQIFSSLYTDRVISYRLDRGIPITEIRNSSISIGVQQMVRSDLACAGVAFTIDTETGFKDVVLINGSYGLGESVVSGIVNPDEVYVHKHGILLNMRSKVRTSPNEHFYAGPLRPILRKRLGSKATKLVFNNTQNKQSTTIFPVPKDQTRKFCLTNDEILILAELCCRIERHYSEVYCPDGLVSIPMDIEWAKDGVDGCMYIVQARPETVYSNATDQEVSIEEFILEDFQCAPEVVLNGASVGRKIGTGKVNIVNSIAEAYGLHLNSNDILVTSATNPDWEPIMKVVGGLITEQGGRTCHAAIVCRELGIPAIIGASDAIHILKSKMKAKDTHARLGDKYGVTIDCSKGENGVVYSGVLPFHIKSTPVTALSQLPCDININIANSDEAFHIATKYGNKISGVGLMRMEFIISNHIQVHPLALLHPERIYSDSSVEAVHLLDTITEYTSGYQNTMCNASTPTAHFPNFFVYKLAEEIATIAAAFYPKPVVVRMSDFKSNEYIKLLGGKYFENTKEENPMLGYRGASRYCTGYYKEAFELECAALITVIETMGLNNVKLMIPFVRTVEEGKHVINLLDSYGISQKNTSSKQPLNSIIQSCCSAEIYMMCEIPSNGLLIDQFYQLFDGFSIGSNDLTQLTLAVDRNCSAILDQEASYFQTLFNEQDDAVLCMISMIIQGVRKNNTKYNKAKTVGICGQAPSDSPEFGVYLIKQGIHSISLNVDSILTTLQSVNKLLQEKQVQMPMPFDEVSDYSCEKRSSSFASGN